MKNIFYIKSSFRSRDIQIFVFLSTPLFLPVSHCFRGYMEKSCKKCAPKASPRPPVNFGK